MESIRLLGYCIVQVTFMNTVKRTKRICCDKKCNDQGDFLGELHMDLNSSY